jgi:hypothetical protein
VGTDVTLSWLQRRLTPRGVRIATDPTAPTASATANG